MENALARAKIARLYLDAFCMSRETRTKNARSPEKNTSDPPQSKKMFVARLSTLLKRELISRAGPTREAQKVIFYDGESVTRKAPRCVRVGGS